MGEAQGLTLEVLGMFQDRNNLFCFKVKEKGGRENVVSREDLLKRDPVALCVFYESKIEMTRK